ncbi:MAG TPA: ChbG/HpnK family deacetylase [Gemmatimonadaceae bacterium]|nr:ChbG/HpnK family deacetylase [Gemmatimonadaceae bacterium]
MLRKRLIINADDFGLSPAVTAGILEAHAAGSVTSTSMMVRCAGWDDAVRQARATASLGVGLHVNLLVGAPLTSARTLTDPRDGRYLPLATVVRRALRRAINAGEVVAECEAQLAALRAEGIRVTHLDSHRHTHALPVIRGAVARVAARHGLPLRRPVESARWFPLDVVSQLHRQVVAWSWRLTTPGASRTRACDHFIGVSMQGGERFPERVLAVLDRLPNGTTELMVHPGRVDDLLRGVDRYTWQRERELEGLVSPGVRERLRRGDFSLIGFGAL